MATGTSVVGFQVLFDRLALTNVQVAVDFTPVFPIQVKRQGYLYLYLSAKTTPFTTELVVRSPLYSPGTRIIIPSPVSVANFNWTLIAQWNASALSWSTVQS